MSQHQHDLATLERWERRLEALLGELHELEAAAERLDELGYPGAEGVLSHLPTPDDCGEGSLATVLDELRRLLLAAGDRGAWLWHFWHRGNQHARSETEVEADIRAWGDEMGPGHGERWVQAYRAYRDRRLTEVFG